MPGIRVKATLSDQVTVFGAVFNGNAARPGEGDPQLRDNHGLAFRVNDPPWLIGQVRWSYDLDFGRGPLAGNFTPGGWYHTGQFDDQRFTAQGASMPIPAEPVLPQNFAAILESSPWSSRRCTDHRR